MMAKSLTKKALSAYSNNKLLKPLVNQRGVFYDTFVEYIQP